MKKKNARDTENWKSIYVHGFWHKKSKRKIWDYNFGKIILTVGVLCKKNASIDQQKSLLIFNKVTVKCVINDLPRRLLYKKTRHQIMIMMSFLDKVLT